jgi:hypothetical protein
MNTLNNGNATNNEAQKKEEQVMDTKVNETTAKNIGNTSAFRKVVDGIIKDFKSDTQELDMIASLVPIHDVLSLENVGHIIKGDKLIWKAEARKNASATKVSEMKATTANQVHGALLELLPAYKVISDEAKRSIASSVSEAAKAKKEVEKSKKRTLNEKQALALFLKVSKETTKKNAGKSSAELKKEAVAKMFLRAINKLYYLRRVSATDVKVNAKDKTLTFTGFTIEHIDGSKYKLTSHKADYTVTLAELARDANTMLKSDAVTSVRGTTKASSAPKQDEAKSVELNPFETVAKNAGEMSKMLLGIAKGKDKGKIQVARNAANIKNSFDAVFQLLFVDEGKLNVVALNKALSTACLKAKVSTVTVTVETEANGSKQSA